MDTRESQQNPKNTNEAGNKIIFKSPKKPRKKMILIIALVAFIALVLAIAIFALTGKEEPTVNTGTNERKSISYNYEESSSNEAYAHFTALSIEQFHQGGSSGGKKHEAHGYYPSAKNFENKEWSKQNLGLDEGIQRLVEKKSIVYKPTECNEDKCKSFTLESDGEVIAKNLVK